MHRLAFLLLVPALAFGRGAPAQDPLTVHHEGMVDQRPGRLPRRDQLDGLLPGPWLRQTVVRPAPPGGPAAPAPIDPLDLTPFPHPQGPDKALPTERAAPFESVERETLKIPIEKRGGHVELELHHLRGTVTFEAGTDDAFEVTLVRRGTGATPEAALVNRDTIRLGVTHPERERHVVETLAWHFPDFDRAIDYVRRGEYPAEAHVFVKAPARAHVLLCSWGGTVSIQGAVGRVKVLTSSGQVDVAGFRGLAEIITSSGAVFLGEGTDAKIKVRTVSGFVYADKVVGDLDLRSRTGKITASYAKMGPGDQHFWTREGAVDVTVPRTAELLVEVHGDRALLSNELPLSAVQEGAHRFRGTLNFAKAYLDVHTEHGRVHLSGN